MSYKIKELFRGQQLTGFDSAHVEIKDISDQTKSFTICASSSRPDRFKDVVVQEGLDWSNWMRNPIVPWSHDYNAIPVAKGTGEPWIQSDGDISKTFIRVQMGSHYEAEQIFGAIQEGLIRSASIGFIPRQSEKIELGEGDEAPMFHESRKYLSAEILEVSLVSLPANSDATMAMKSMIQRGQLPAYIMDGLDLQHGDHTSWRLEEAIDRLGDLEDDELDDEDFSEILDEIEDDDLSEDDDDFNKAEAEALVSVALREALGRLD